MSGLKGNNELRLSVRLTGILAQQVTRIINEDGIYENQSEYIRDLIRRDLEERSIGQNILNGLEDLKKGRLSKKSISEIGESLDA